MRKSEKPCPRARCMTISSRRFLVRTDPAVMEVAKKVVAGMDCKYTLYRGYAALVRQDGKKRTQELIRNAVSIPGTCDIIQTEMGLGGVGLFGGLSEDGQTFIFYEWGVGPPEQRYCSMTVGQARNIVAGKQRFIEFKSATAEHNEARKAAKRALSARS